MKLFRWTDPDWLAAYMRWEIKTPANLTDSYEFSLDYGSVVCEFEYNWSNLIKESVFERSDDVSSYDQKIMSDSSIDGFEWDIGKNKKHFRIKSEKLKLIRIHFHAPIAESFSELVKSNRKYVGLTQKEFAKRTHVSQAKIAEYENARRVPEISKIRIFGAFLPQEQVLHSEGISITI